MKNRFHKEKRQTEYWTKENTYGASYHVEKEFFVIVDKKYKKEIFSYGDKEITQRVMTLLNKYSKPSR